MSDKPNKAHFEVFIAMNEEGDIEVGTDAEDAADRLSGNQGGYHCRIVRIGGFMTPPRLAELTVDIPDDAGETQSIESPAA
jgi:hypothetical protein